jgi:hypothetical protein
VREQQEYELELMRREKMRQEAERLAVIEAEKRRVSTYCFTLASFKSQFIVLL